MRKYLMTWDRLNFKWQKMVRGKMYRVSCADLRLPRSQWTKEASYQAANDWWQQQEAERQAKIQAIKGRMAELAEERKTLMLEWAGAAVADLAEQHGLQGEGQQVRKQLEYLQTPVPGPKTLSCQIGEFLSVVRSNVRPKSYQELQDTLARLKGHLGENFDCSGVSEQTVVGYFRHVKNLAYAPITKKKTWIIFRRFIRFLFQSGISPLPRNLDSKEFRFGVRPQKIKEWPREQVRQELAALPPRLRLYALLALNCGFRNTDISACRKDQYDGRYITHKRVKTDKYTDVPEVRFLLWRETREALESGKAKDGDLLFCSKAGTPLVEHQYKGNEVTTKDLITQQFKRRSHTIPLAAYRSIGSTIIGGHREYGRYTSHYLGHSPKGIADRHYVAPSQELFDEIMTWLGKQVMGEGEGTPP